MNSQHRNPLIIALDMTGKKVVESVCKELSGLAGMFKIGLELFSAMGQEAIELVDRNKGGAGIFLDLKLHDIPNTVEKAAYQLSKLGIDMLNVHALGGEQMMLAAVKGLEAAERETGKRPKLIAVTVLTSSTDADVKQVGLSLSAKECAVHLAKLAFNAALDGVVCSVQDVKRIREVTSEDFITVCPGIRPTWAVKDDQARVATPKAAIKARADYIVVGRPIVQSENMRESARLVLKEAGLV